MGFCSSSVGIIPAYAGSTIYLEQPHLLNPDHPRIRGEHLDQKPPAPAGGGSSPHTRGAPALFDPGSAWIRIIPAYAGSTITVPFRCCSGADHPRIRGEHDEVPDGDALAVGSSPHTRGARVEDGARLGGGRIIPAYAGSTAGAPPAPTTFRDHPRIRGEHDVICMGWATGPGSSPHTRGAHVVHGTHGLLQGIIPAYAGSTCMASAMQGLATGSSPHTRGAPEDPRHADGVDRIIPAYAGSTRGEAHYILPAAGSSPHTRGALADS